MNVILLERVNNLGDLGDEVSSEASETNAAAEDSGADSDEAKAEEVVE